mgnify:CR=1 FL=1
MSDTPGATTSVAVALDSPESYLDYGMRLVATQTDAFWHHPARESLRNYVPLCDALSIIERFEDDYEVLTESGPAGSRVILTPMRVNPGSEDAGPRVITDLWMTARDLEDVLDRSVKTIRRWARGKVEKRQVVSANGILHAIRMTPDTVEAMSHRFGVELHRDIREEGYEVRPYEIEVPPLGMSAKAMAKEVRVSRWHFWKTLKASDIPLDGPIKPTPQLRSWLRKTYDVQLLIASKTD